MAAAVDLYDNSYERFSADVQRVVRAETYGEDIGQSGWMTADELRRFIVFLNLKIMDNVLEIGSGSGGPALFLAEMVNCRLVGLDVNEFGVKNSMDLALQRGLESQAEFRLADASRQLPFEPETFDAVISNDAMCHVAGRLEVLKEWRRVLKPGGRMVFTDALVITGIVSHEEIARRSAIGHYFFVPNGENERLIREAGFELIRADDLTIDATNIAKRWHDARANHRAELIHMEGETNFAGLQDFLSCVHTLCSENRLSRFAYLAQKPSR
jgi:ubiquinone/menaquinone biosynthesis C-methylase UbiE